MNKVERIKLGISSLSLFRGIMTRSVPAALYELLISLDKAPREFLAAYGRLFSLLCERNCADSFGRAVMETALFDDNCFTRAAADGRLSSLSGNVLDAARRDLRTVAELSRLGSDEILGAYPLRDGLEEFFNDLPRWERGSFESPLEDFDGSFDAVEAYFRRNGCGMFARYKAFVWRDGDIRPIENYDTVRLEDFTGYERQREKVIENTRAFIQGKTCNNCLLYGDMGTGKSSTVKAVGNLFRENRLRIVEMPKERLIDFPLLVDKIAKLPMKFIIFIDDLSFNHQDQSYTTLKAVLEGGLAARPENALIYATSNRRHIVKEKLSDRAFEVDDVNTRDNMQETLSLSDRFGLAVCFTVPGKKEYIEIVRAMAKDKKIIMEDSELAAGAERFALARGGRSPRCAKQYVESLFC